MDSIPYTLGIAHPPGFPLYVLIGFVWSHAFAIGSVAWRMSALSGVAIAVAALAVIRIARGNIVAGLIFGLGGIVWADATRAEVHAVFVAIAAWWLVAALEWYEHARTRDAVLAGALWGVAFTVHPLAFTLLLPAIVLLVARLHEMRSSDIAYAALAAVPGALLPWLYMPVVDPSLRSLSGWAQYLGVVDAHVSYHGISAATAAYVLLGFQGRAIVAACALAGIVRAWRGDVARTLAVALFGACPALVGTHFDESDPNRYFLCASVALSIFAAAAFVRSQRPWVTRASLALQAALVCACLVLLPHFMDQRSDERARRETDAIVAVTPPNAVIVSTWTLTPPLRYRALVEHTLEHRTVVSAWYGDVADQLPGWLRDRSVYVSGVPEGDIAGYRVEPVAAQTELYRVVPNR